MRLAAWHDRELVTDVNLARFEVDAVPIGSPT